nr:ulp1 protease family, C-terminal catalytic domain-containing protein [Tanacetum cinerariifolium]
GSFSNQVKARLKGNEGGLALQDVDLPSTTSLTMLNNSVANYDTKYKEVCGLLKKLFARRLKFYGHSRHGTVGRLKHKIPNLKWRTSESFHDCGVFTMLHMESFNGETASKWDCRLSVESGLQCDMLRRLRFKFATKILLHNISVHTKKMLKLANEFDKVDSLERVAIIIEAVKNREECDRI